MTMVALDDMDEAASETVSEAAQSATEEERSKRARIKKIKTGFRCAGLVVLLVLLVWSAMSGAMVKNIAFSAVGGLGIFLFGMQIMSSGLQKLAGKRLKQFLETITSNPVSAVMVGAGVTAIIQSSSATTVMVIGFVNSGFMTLAQAIGVILGANIGTTITAQLIAFKISAYALPAAGLGFFMSLFSKDRKWRVAGNVLLGFGLLFLGLSIMKSALTPLKESGAVRDIFLMFRSNPILAVIAGAVMTMLLQSSSATIGLTMGMAGSGLISFEIAVPFILGENIGTTITAALACIGANVSAKRAALSHAMFNIIGVMYVFLMLKLFCRLVDVITPGAAADPATIERHIANSHTLFNVVNTIVFLPFIKVFVHLTRKVVPGEEPVSQEPHWLDKRLLHTPFMAISAAIKELRRMADLGQTMLRDAFTALFEDDEDALKAVFENEQAVDNLEHEITHYLVLIAEKDLSRLQSEWVSNLLYITKDLERVGDHIENIAELVNKKQEEKLSFSDQALTSLKKMYKVAAEILNAAGKALEENDQDLADDVYDYEGRIDEMEESLRQAHIERLNKKLCHPTAGILFLDIISNLERVADHCNNIADVVSKHKYIH